MRLFVETVVFVFLAWLVVLSVFGIHHAIKNKKAARHEARQEESRVNVRWLRAAQECRWNLVPDFALPDRDTGEPGYDFEACMKTEYARLLGEGK